MSDRYSFLKREVNKHSSSMMGMQSRDLSMQFHEGCEDLSAVLKGLGGKMTVTAVLCHHDVSTSTENIIFSEPGMDA